MAVQRRLLFKPEEWSRPLDWLPVLAAFLATAEPNRGVELQLDARSEKSDGALPEKLVAAATRYLSPNRTDAPVAMVVGGGEVTEGTVVRSAEDLLERLGENVRILPDTDRAVVNHARWAKTLVDELQHIVDTDRLATAPRVQRTDAPLVTVRIPTFGSAELLVERAIPSVLNGTYSNVEVLVCSDGPQPHARAAVAAIQDRRVRYMELDERPRYPTRRWSFWQTAGIYALNRLLDEVRGDFIAPLDHDDAFTEDHIERHVTALLRTGADFSWGDAMLELPGASWVRLGGEPLRHGHVVHAAVLYSARLRHMRYDPVSWLLREPGDWNMWRRIRATGAQLEYVPEVTALHFRERSSVDHIEDESEDLVELAEDVLGTDAARLLTISSRFRGARGLSSAAPHAVATRPPSARGVRHLAWIDDGFLTAEGDPRAADAHAMAALLDGVEFFAKPPFGGLGSIHAVSLFPELAEELGITDVYVPSARLALELIGLTEDAAQPSPAIIRTLRDLGIALQVDLGTAEQLSPPAVRSIVSESETVFVGDRETAASFSGVHYVPNSVDTDFYTYRPRDSGSRLRICFLADRPWSFEGLDTLMRTRQMLGEFDVEIAVQLAELPLGVDAPGVTFRSQLSASELRELFWRADVLFSPHRLAGPSAVTVGQYQALACGCALVAERPAGSGGPLDAPQHYLTVRPGDTQTLAATLERLASDRTVVDKLGQQGAERVRELMNPTKVARARLRRMGLLSSADVSSTKD